MKYLTQTPPRRSVGMSGISYIRTVRKMSFSFREKSLGLMFVTLAVTFTLYFATVLPLKAPNVQPQHVALFALAVVILTIIAIAGHVIIAILDRRTATDERDRLIELKGKRNASYVMATGVFLALCIPLLTPGTFLLTHVLLGFWVLAQLTEIGSQLILLRHGA